MLLWRRALFPGLSRPGFLVFPGFSGRRDGFFGLRGRVGWFRVGCMTDGVSELSAEELAVLEEIRGAPRPPRERPVPRPRVVKPPKVPRPREKKPKGSSLAALSRQKRVVELRVAGLKYADIGEELGISPSAARKSVERWINAQKPPEEQTVELREVMQQRLEDLHAAYWKYAHGFTSKRGNVIPPDPKAGEFLLKIMERHARLMGVDMQPAAVTMLISAESVARFLGWDAGADGGVVDVAASEVRELGAGEAA